MSSQATVHSIDALKDLRQRQWLVIGAEDQRYLHRANRSLINIADEAICFRELR